MINIQELNKAHLSDSFTEMQITTCAHACLYVQTQSHAGPLDASVTLH